MVRVQQVVTSVMGSACKWGWGQTVGHESEGRSQEAARLPGRLGVSECTAGSDLASNWGSGQTCGSSRAGSRGALGSLTQWVLGVGGWGWRMHFSRVRRACEKSEVPRRATHSGTRSGGVACKKGDTEVRANGKREQRVRRWFYGWQVHRRLILSGDQSVGKGGKFVRGRCRGKEWGASPAWNTGDEWEGHIRHQNSGRLGCSKCLWIDQRVH